MKINAWDGLSWLNIKENMDQIMSSLRRVLEVIIIQTSMVCHLLMRLYELDLNGHGKIEISRSTP